jgi:hypothetical protein
MTGMTVTKICEVVVHVGAGINIEVLSLSISDIKLISLG